MPDYIVALFALNALNLVLLAGLEIRSLLYARLIVQQQQLLLNRRPRVSPDQRRRVCRVLAESGLFDTPIRRSLLLRDLPDQLVGSLHGDGSTLVDLNEMVYRVARWHRDAWVLFLNNALDELQDSAAGDELRRVCQERL
jgi:hypothetical protein